MGSNISGKDFLGLIISDNLTGLVCPSIDIKSIVASTRIHVIAVLDERPLICTNDRQYFLLLNNEYEIKDGKMYATKAQSLWFNDQSHCNDKSSQLTMPTIGDFLNMYDAIDMNKRMGWITAMAHYQRKIALATIIKGLKLEEKRILKENDK